MLWFDLTAVQSPADSSEGGVPFPHKLGPGDAIVNENLMLQVMQYVMSLPDMERSEASMRAISGVCALPIARSFQLMFLTS